MTHSSKTTRRALLACVVAGMTCAQVRAGTIKEARASAWGFDPVDSTESLQAAIQSGVPRLRVDNMGTPWIVDRITLVSNQEIVFEEGVVVQAKKGAFKGTGDSLFSLPELENVALIGYGATLRMNRVDYAGPDYKSAEWRHVLTLRGCRNVKIYGLTLAESGGDGIYLGAGPGGAPNRNVHILDVTCDRNYRQGISVISAEDLLIENTVMRHTAGTAPQAGIDFEPNNTTERLVNCVMRNCISESNAGAGFCLSMAALQEPVSIRFENCVARGNNSRGFYLTTGGEVKTAARGSIEAVNCRFADAVLGGIVVGPKPAGAVRVRFVDCVVENVALEQPDIAPVILRSAVGAIDPTGGIAFENLDVIDPVDRPFLQYNDWAGGAPLTGVTGRVTVRRGGTETVHPITSNWLEERFPLATKRTAIGRLDTAGFSFAPVSPGAWPGSSVPMRPFSLRGQGTLAIFAAESDTVSFTLRFSQVAKYSGAPLSIHAVSPSGTAVSMGSVPFQGEAALRFVARETGLHRIPLAIRANRLELLQSSHPAVVSGEEQPIHFYQAAGDFYFFVPAGTERFAVAVWGDNVREAIGAAVYDPRGNKVWENDRITLPEFFVHTDAASQGQVWELRLAPPRDSTWEDFHVDLRGIPAFLSSEADALVRPVE